MTSMLPSTSSCLRQGPTHVTDTGRCPTPCPNLTEVARLGQLSLCCSQSGASPSSQTCSDLFPALQLSHAVVCAATEPLVRCSQDPPNLQTTSVLYPDWRGEPVITGTSSRYLLFHLETGRLLQLRCVGRSVAGQPSQETLDKYLGNCTAKPCFCHGCQELWEEVCWSPSPVRIQSTK